MTEEKPFIKKLSDIPIEDAHGGSGKRQLILTQEDHVSERLQAMTKGFLSAGAVFDWHKHEGVDELFFVIKGDGLVEFRETQGMSYANEDVVYVPSNIEHKITAQKDTEFIFIRLNR